jgi:sugar-specific transcriptional regulator TrmB
MNTSLQKKLLKILEELGFTQNEAKIYLVLFFSGAPLNASEISNYSNVPRPNVYETINKLIEKGFVLKEASSRGGRYVAIIPQEMLDMLRKRYEQRLKLIDETILQFKEMLNRSLGESKLSAMSTIEFINDEEKITRIIGEVLESAQSKLITIITPDVLEIEGKNIVRMLRRLAKRNVDITVGIKTNDDYKYYVRELSKISTLYLWTYGELPLGCYIADDTNCLVTLVGKWSPIVSYNVGIFTGNPLYTKSFGYFAQKLLTLTTQEIEIVKEIRRRR